MTSQRNGEPDRSRTITNHAIPARAVPCAKVVCIDDKSAKSCSWDKGEALSEGAAYTIESVVHDRYPFAVLHLKEGKRSLGSIVCFGPLVGYGVYRFKPAGEPKTLEEDTALFEDISRGMSLVDRLDRLAEVLNA